MHGHVDDDRPWVCAPGPPSHHEGQPERACVPQHKAPPYLGPRLTYPGKCLKHAQAGCCR
eukprot:8802140-Alexandrium_andersonii.AAC.1